MRKLIAILSLAALLVAPTSVLAANSASSNETLSSVVTITLTGVPATLDYGTVSPNFSGDRWSGAGTASAGIFTINFGADFGTASLKAAGTDLTGPATIAKTNRKICDGGGAVNLTGFSVTSCAAGGTSMSANQSMGSTNASGVTGTVKVNLGWMLTNPTPGAYTGSVTFTVSQP